jgi:hypothetical protein
MIDNLSEKLDHVQDHLDRVNVRMKHALDQVRGWSPLLDAGLQHK